MALAMVLIIVGLIGDSIGERRASVHAQTGSGYSAETKISIKARGWWYAVPTDLHWQSADGTWHEDGRPACLPPTGNVGPIRFGEVSVTEGDTRWRQVVWVSCVPTSSATR